MTPSEAAIFVQMAVIHSLDIQYADYMNDF